MILIRHRRGDRPDHHRAVHRGRRRAALHRPADPGRSLRPRAADRRGGSARHARRLHRPSVADPASADVSTIDIDRDAAHDAAQRELDKPIYPRGSLTDGSSTGSTNCCTSSSSRARRCPAAGSPSPCCSSWWRSPSSSRSASPGAPCAPTAVAERAVRHPRAHLGRAPRHRGTVCGARRLGRGDPAPAARGRPPPRGDGGAQPRARAHGHRAGPRRRRGRSGPRRANCVVPQRLSTTSPTASGPAPSRLPDGRRPRRPPPRHARRPPTAARDEPPAPPTAGPRCDDRHYRRRSARRSCSGGAPSGGCCWRSSSSSAVSALTHVSHRAAAGRPDGPGVHVGRRRPRAGHAAARPRRRRRRGRIRRRRRAGRAARHPAGRRRDLYLVDDDGLRRLAAVPGDLLLVEPVSRTREALAPAIRARATTTSSAATPIATCRRPTARVRSQFGTSDTYEADDGVADHPLLRRRAGALHRRRPHRHRRRQRGLHDELAACSRRATPRWR